MERINIAELLKDCPSGIELDCTMYDNVVLEFVVDVKEDTYPIKLKTKNGTLISATEYGCYDMCADAKCVIFPKGKTTWKGFHRPFKDGDIVYVRDEYSDETFNDVAIIKQIEKGGKIHCYCFYNYEEDDFSTNDFLYDGYIRFATEEEKEKLFQAIKTNGYMWNAETKTLEKLIVPYFKIGDKIRHKYVKTIIRTIDHIYYDNYALCNGTSILFKDQDDWELVSNIELKFKVGDIVRSKNCPKAGSFVIVDVKEDRYLINLKNNYIKFKDQDNWELVPNKFDINTLKPFDKVLVRTKTFTPVWTIDFYDGYQPNIGGSFTPFGVIGGKYFQQCIPYEGNEHLRGTTKDCNEYFKTWK